MILPLLSVSYISVNPPIAVMILNRRKEGGQIPVQLCLQDEDKFSYAPYLEYLKRLSCFESITSSAYHHCMLKF